MPKFEVSILKKRVALGIKQLTEEPEQTEAAPSYKKNSVVTCIVVSSNDGVKLLLMMMLPGLLKSGFIS